METDAPTIQDLAAKSEAKRAEVVSSATSRKPAGLMRYHDAAAEMPDVAVQLLKQTCDCGTEYDAAQLPGGTIKPERCPACAGALQQPATAEPVRSGNQIELWDAMDRAGVNVPKYKNATLETFDPNPDGHALAAAHRYIAMWESRRGAYASREWMFLFGRGSTRRPGGVEIGSLGNGKTFLAIAVARELLERGRVRPDRFRFRTAESILLEAEATFRSNSTDSEILMMRRYETLDLLIIDEVGVRHNPSPHAIRIFDELVKRRECRGTIWTSNLSLEVLEQAGSELGRITSRIAGECGDGAEFIVGFNGPNRRIERSMMPRVA